MANPRTQIVEKTSRTATILFMDVVGSTQISERLDPEYVHAVMDTALEHLTSIVHAHSGRVLQYAGDSLLAVFGADQALEDDAERAVRAGLAILAAAAPLAADFRGRYDLDGFALRVGQHYERALEIARAMSDRRMESAMLNNLGDIERFLGNYEVAFAHFEAGRRLCAEIGERLADAYLLCNLAFVTFRQGRAAESLEWARQSADACEQLRDRDLQASVANLAGNALASLGQLDEAEERYAASLTLFREIGRTTMAYEPLAGLARAALTRGDVGRALATVDEIVAHFDAGGSIEGTEDPLWIYLTCYEVLASADDRRAGRLLLQAHGILMSRATPLADAERTTFLKNVPSHRAILDAWRRAGMPSAPTDAT